MRKYSISLHKQCLLENCHWENTRFLANETYGTINLSADGTVAAIGKTSNNMIGQVNVFKYRQDSGWTLRGSLINEENVGSNFGK